MSGVLATWMLELGDYGFLFFHTVLVLFNMFGWLVKSWRKLHLIVIGLTFVSWFLLGFWYGWGYCILTDWHWRILAEKGETGMPDSYISYLLVRFFGLELPDLWVDILTVGIAFNALILSIYYNFFATTKGHQISR
jgi:hypothetical protein